MTMASLSASPLSVIYLRASLLAISVLAVNCLVLATVQRGWRMISDQVDPAPTPIQTESLAISGSYCSSEI